MVNKYRYKKVALNISKNKSVPNRTCGELVNIPDYVTHR